MKKLTPLLLLFFCLPALACDEECKRNAAMEEHDVEFPGYLNAGYCQDTSVDFLLRARESLQKYRDGKLETGHKGGIRNIRNFLQQRKQWLLECDNYLQLTGQGRVFKNAETTERIVSTIESVSRELDRLMSVGSGVHVPVNQLGGATARFDQLFMVVDTHRTDLQLRGQLVIR